MMRAITISRQMGSMGRDVANILAKQLGYQVVWREVINQAASRARTPEVALAAIDELDLLGLRPPMREVQAYHDAVRELMQEYVEQGSIIIVGRAGQVILRGIEGVLHVRLYAPIDVRTERIAQRNQITIEAARLQVEASDKYRQRYLRRFYHAQWDDPDLYDLMVNTAHFSVVETASIIGEAVKNRLAP